MKIVREAGIYAFAVEQVMKSYAKKFSKDNENWAFNGLLQDFDYEMYPNIDEHPYTEVKRGKSRYNASSLGQVDFLNTRRKALMAKTLFAVGELYKFMMVLWICKVR